MYHTCFKNTGIGWIVVLYAATLALTASPDKTVAADDVIYTLNFDDQSCVLKPGAVVKNVHFSRAFITPLCDAAANIYRIKEVNFDGSVLGTFVDKRFTGGNIENYYDGIDGSVAFDRCSLKNTVLAGTDFTVFDSTGVSDFENALIKGNKENPCVICQLSAEQMRSTLNYKNIKNFSHCHFENSNFTNVNFAEVVFENVSFAGCNFGQCRFADTQFTGHCRIDSNITLAQIKQTWNYKTGNMTGIKLPPDIQKALDEEKKK